MFGEYFYFFLSSNFYKYYFLCLFKLSWYLCPDQVHNSHNYSGIFHFLCCWLFSHAALIHVIVFSRHGGTITPHKDPILNRLPGGKSGRCRKKTKQKKPIAITTINSCLLNFILGKNLSSFCFESSQTHWGILLLLERHNSAQIHILSEKWNLYLWHFRWVL